MILIYITKGLRSKLFNLHSYFILLSSDYINNAKLNLSGYTIFKCDKSIHSSNLSRGDRVLIAVKNTLRPQLIPFGVLNVKQLFVCISVNNDPSAIIGVVYILSNANLSLYERYAKSVDVAWESVNCDLGIFCGDINLPRVYWRSTNQGFTFSGAINDNSSLISDQFLSMDFLQFNTIHNTIGSLFDLIFFNSNCVSISEAPDSLVLCDSYRPALSFKYQDLVPLIILNDDHMFRDFNYADYDSFVLTLTYNHCSVTFNQEPADISASVLQESIYDRFHRFVQLKSFRKSNFPAWVSSELKSLIYKKKKHIQN